MDRKRFSLFKIILETFSELILIFTAAAAGVSIGQRGHLMKSEWILATFGEMMKKQLGWQEVKA